MLSGGRYQRSRFDASTIKHLGVVLISGVEFARSAIPHTRITLFIVGVALEPGDLPFVTVQAEDSQQRLFDLPCEATARVKNLSWMSQVTVRLPDTLVGAGNLNVSVSVRGKVSNKAPIRIE